MKDCGFQFESSYTKLPKLFYSFVDPVPVASPKMVILNHDLSANLGLDFSKISLEEQAHLFSGNKMPKQIRPFAQAYAGHQFGHFTMLGDGRALVWGEHLTPDGKIIDLQFKGSGRTPYSRHADGRATLGSMLREYLISEAMHHLEIPTTRSLAVIKTGEYIVRESMLPSAILTRTASSHIRIGTFQFAAMHKDKNLIHSFLDYTIERHNPNLKEVENKAIALINDVMEKQADLIAHWIRIGFIHGVMNTDNMTLSGETIDYGPCAFMDVYDPNTVFSSIDNMGRYCYANQPKIAQWNIAKLAETLLPLIHEDIDQAVNIATETIKRFPEIYQNKWLTMMRKKLGLFGEHKNDILLISDLYDWMQESRADFTNTFRYLSQADKHFDQIYTQKSFKDWYDRWQLRLRQNTEPLESSLHLMQKNNPSVIPRNHKVEQALEAAYLDNLKPFHELLNVLKDPYKNSEDIPESYKSPPSQNEKVYKTFCGT